MKTVPIYIPARRLLRDVTIRVNVTNVQGTLVRLWIARQLVKLAGWVLGCRVDYEGPGRL